ncbi:glycosyltransferase family 2 protein [Massilia sp. W12]|uniref:glycosyltransferase family 2 protein n=1 Tax=Massilia sp. W12 TaxID=3126507 RepID=UPI0030D0C260
MTQLAQREKPVVCAVVVSYQPQPERLRRLLETMVLQANAVLVVDNGSRAQSALQNLVQEAGAYFLPLAENIGLAAGFNRGIAWAMARNASHVMLFDQDSAPTPSMLRQMLFAENWILQQGLPLAALGPAFVDVKTRVMGDVIGPEAWFTRRKRQPDLAMLIRAAYLISSGKLIRTSVLREVGLMDEKLFIDAVDTEWCLRARNLGLECFCVTDAMMQHDLGDSSTSIGKRKIALHSPLRHYYIMRNAILLMRMAHIPWRFKCTEAYKSLRRLIGWTLLCRPRLKHLQYMLRGIVDGLRGKSGPADRPPADSGGA